MCIKEAHLRWAQSSRYLSVRPPTSKTACVSVVQPPRLGYSVRAALANYNYFVMVDQATRCRARRLRSPNPICSFSWKTPTPPSLMKKKPAISIKLLPRKSINQKYPTWLPTVCLWCPSANYIITKSPGLRLHGLSKTSRTQTLTPGNTQTSPSHHSLHLTSMEPFSAKGSFGYLKHHWRDIQNYLFQN